MVKAKLTSNGMINFPAKLRKKLGIKPGDEVSFIETEEGVLVIPVVDILDATDPNDYEKAVEIVKEVRNERDNEKW